MAPAHLEFLARHLRLGFYARDEVITEPARGAAGHFYIIKQGRVRGETGDDTGPSEDGAWELVAGECFPIGALLARRPVRTLHRAVEDTFCFELEREDFDKLLGLSPVFHDFCTRRLANLLDQALQGVQAGLATAAATGEASLNAPLSSLIRRAPVSCLPQTPIREALQSMNKESVGSIVITDAEQQPLGVFTLHDLLGRVATSGISLEAPIEQVMTRRPLSLSPQAAVYEAAALMARMGFGHVCVVENGRLAGVVSERDLFSLQRVGLVQLSRSITHAPDIDTLARLGRDVHRVIDQMLVQGASVAQLTQIITLLNDHITRRVITLCVAGAGAPPAAFTWLSFGSEGRQEQTLKTDQDNGILFIPPDGRSAQSVREELLPLAQKINQALDACGYPLCRGNIMAGNPECCLSLEEWQARFLNWIEHGTPEHLLNASIFFDFRAIYGERAPMEELRRWVAERVAVNTTFLRQMAENALRNRPPLGLVRDFVLSDDNAHPHTIDLKLNGATPFVDAARIFALAAGSAQTNTAKRLRAAARALHIPDAELADWNRAFHFLQLLRLRHQHEQQRTGITPDNHLDPDTLNPLDRRILKEALRQARKVQARLALDYQL
ncbi:MAG TPA: putative nucleotidyltransferase substrate binding domain-containing protein [Sulfuricaulis sp.]|nr:putative nucleotidyltransferase substrate binding domain-containing protein [Sulfuricaulis sp.]